MTSFDTVSSQSVIIPQDRSVSPSPALSCSSPPLPLALIPLICSQHGHQCFNYSASRAAFNANTFESRWKFISTPSPFEAVWILPCYVFSCSLYRLLAPHQAQWLKHESRPAGNSDRAGLPEPHASFIREENEWGNGNEPVDSEKVGGDKESSMCLGLPMYCFESFMCVRACVCDSFHQQ